jgi:hypothetical protein
LSLQEQDGLRVWKLPKPAALALLRQESQLAQTAHTFYQALHLVRKKARSALLAVPGLLRTHPWNDQIASESAHGIPKFTIWGGEVASRAVSLCQKEWSNTALNGVSGLGSTLPSSLIDPYEWKERYSGVTYHELSFRRRKTIKHLFR